MLYLACTRGAQTYGGVPAFGFGANFLFCYLGYMVVGRADILHFRGYMWPPLFAIIHFAMRRMVERDPNIFRIIQTMFDTTVIGFNQVIWSAPWRTQRKAKDLTSAF
jgi:type IV secretory pathway VirB3-like protein